MSGFYGYVYNHEYRNGERNEGNAGNRGNVIFRGMSPNILGNVLKLPGEYNQRFSEMPTTGLLSNSTVGRLSIRRSCFKLFVVCSQFYKK